MVIVILGPDTFLARHALASHRAKFDPGGLNTDLVDGRAASIDEIERVVNTPAFFGGRRTVVVEGFLERFGKKGSSEGETSSKVKALPDVGAIAAIFVGAANTLFFEPALSSVPAAVKKAMPKDVAILIHEAPRGHELIRWMRGRVEAGGAELPEPLARKLAELLFPKTWSAKPSNPAYDRPPELERLAQEIEKLTLSAYPEAITAALIDEMVVTSHEDRLFPLIEAIYAGETKHALTEIESARERGDDPGRLANSLHQQAELAAAIAPGRGLAEIGQELGLSNPNRMFGVSKSSQRARRAPSAWLRRLVAIERAVKAGELRDPWDPLYAALESDR